MSVSAPTFTFCHSITNGNAVGFVKFVEEDK